MKKNPDRKHLMTIPEKITTTETLYLTGNEYLSMPHIEPSGGIKSLNILRLDQRGLLEFCGSKNKPLLEPLLKIDDQVLDLAKPDNPGCPDNPERRMKWHYQQDWLPSFTVEDQGSWTLEGEIIAPPGFKGFCYRLALQNNSNNILSFQLGWQGCWESFNYIIFNRRPIDGKHSLFFDQWTGSLILEASAGLPLAALALAAEPFMEWHYDSSAKIFSAEHKIDLKPGEHYEICLYGAVNLESDGAGTSNIDLRRLGYDYLKNSSVQWLESRRIINGEHADLNGLLNRNLFFCYFFAVARSLDSEELVPVTSRSPRYYVSSAFWSRDTLLWSFPAILIVDQVTARELLLAVFSRHIKNAGDHAHYINGSVLYPGFELDQLAAYFLALEHYIKKSGDESIYNDTVIREGLNTLVGKVFDHFDPQAGLYSTFLSPSDDPVSFPFLTYNNVLLQRSFSFLAKLQAEERLEHKSDFAILARELQQAIFDHCMVKGPVGTMFAWAVDGKGRFSLYDNPPGSLQLLAYYGFCSTDDTIFNNTVRWIRSSNNKFFYQGSNFEEAGSLHAENPWPLGACNDLLACSVSAFDFLRKAEMDCGFFCESIDQETGRVSTGAAFASAAGFLAYAITYRRSKSENDCKADEQNSELMNRTSE